MKANSRHSSLQISSKFSLKIISKTHEFSKNHSIILSFMINPAISIDADEQDQLLEDTLAKFKANHLIHINIQSDKSHFSTSIASKSHEKTTTISMKHLHDVFQ